MEARRLRILFVDDEDLQIIGNLKAEGFDVEHWRDVESLEKLADGRYHVVFLDVRGVGKKHGGTGLDVLRYLAIHNPLVFTIVFSAKPFTPQEGELLRKHANRCMTKDCTFYDVVEAIEDHAKTLTPEKIIENLEKTVKLGWFTRRRILKGTSLSERQLEALARKSGIASDAVKIVANCTQIAATLLALSA